MTEGVDAGAVDFGHGAARTEMQIAAHERHADRIAGAQRPGGAAVTNGGYLRCARCHGKKTQVAEEGSEQAGRPAGESAESGRGGDWPEQRAEPGVHAGRRGDADVRWTVGERPDGSEGLTDGGIDRLGRERY